MSPHDGAKVDLRLGSALQQIHGVENDWFGIACNAEEWKECYSWQECFTLLLETVLIDAEKSALTLPFEELRRALSRAIGYYLFDDVEVPVLVWSSSLDWDGDAFVGDVGSGELSGLCGWGGAVWGDPLMEGALRKPSQALIEGYGGSPIVFARQKTKRLWYTVLAALQDLVNLTNRDKGNILMRSAWNETSLKELIEKTAQELKDAPCY